MARRHLALALVKPIFRKGVQDVFRHPNPHMFAFTPRHPALLAKVIKTSREPIHLS